MKKYNFNNRIYAVHHEGIFEAIRSNMSYRDILNNVYMLEKEKTGFLPDYLASETISASTPLLKGENFLFFLDISTVIEKCADKNIEPIIPMYEFLLESYGITVEQFLDDFYVKMVKEVSDEIIEKKALINNKGDKKQ